MIKKTDLKKYEYQYIKSGRIYVCIQQNILLLAWFILLKNKSLGLAALGVTHSKGLNLIKMLIRFRLSSNHSAKVIVLPLVGNLALDVHRGYKIFLFSRMNVAKVITSEISVSNMMQEMESVRMAGRLKIAPSISQYNYENRWYVEDYVSGQFLYIVHKVASEELYKMYESEIIKCLVEIILSHPPKTVTLINYVQNLVNNILEDLLPSLELEQQKRTIILEFIRSVEASLRDTSTENIELVFSHGDFSLQNLLKTRNTIKVIDWEGAKCRSILYDFYNFFLTEIYYERSTGNLVNEIHNAQSILESQLIAKSMLVIKKTMLSEPHFLWLFFLERIQMLLNRDISKRNLNVLMRSIEVFRNHEKIIAKNND